MINKMTSKIRHNINKGFVVIIKDKRKNQNIHQKCFSVFHRLATSLVQSCLRLLNICSVLQNHYPLSYEECDVTRHCYVNHTTIKTSILHILDR